MTTATPTPRALSWDVVRVVAVISVVVQHATFTVSGVMPFLAPPPFVWPVEAGANVLMVVSGFFLCVTLAKRGAGGWWWHRIARLVPAYLVAVVLTYLVTLLAAAHGYWRPGLRDLAGNLLLIQSWDPRVTSMDGSYWTMPLQIGAFSLAALGVAVVGRHVWRRPGALPALAWAGMLGPLVLGTLATGWLRVLVNGLVVFRWQLFAIGLALWLAHRGRISLPHLFALATAGVFVEHVLTPDPRATLALVVGCLVMSAAAVGPDWDLLKIGPLPRILSWLGGISFGIYLLNQQIGYFAAWALQDGVGITGWVRIVLVLALAVVLGWLLTVLAERPLHRLLTGRSAQRGTQRGNERAAARNRSFSSGVPVDTRTPSPANARTTTLLSSAWSENDAAASPSGSQTKFAADSGTR